MESTPYRATGAVNKVLEAVDENDCQHVGEIDRSLGGGNRSETQHVVR